MYVWQCIFSKLLNLIYIYIYLFCEEKIVFIFGHLTHYDHISYMRIFSNAKIPTIHGIPIVRWIVRYQQAQYVGHSAHIYLKDKDYLKIVVSVLWWEESYTGKRLSC